jgi:2,3-dihydroxybenzoate-AMP ligase
MSSSPKAEDGFAVIEAEGVTITALVPTLAIRWLESSERSTFDLGSLRVLQVGGARLNPEVARRVGPELGCTLQQVFGMGEGLLNYTRLDDPEEVVVGTQGRPMSPADEVLVVDADGRPVSEGQPGELLTRGPYTIRGYYRAEEHNARAFTPDGFYRTGDVVRFDSAGNLIVEGRMKDLVNRGGEKISAEEIENLLLGHSSVSNAAAVAMPDPVMGEKVCAYVVLRPGAAPLTVESLREYLVGRGIARYKWPERIETVDALPVTKVGKVDKKALRDDIAGKLQREGSGAAG